MESQVICLPTITLEWSDWYDWNELKKDARTDEGIKIPNGKAGVYEARIKGSEERLTIGKATDLRFRVRQCLVKGKSDHSGGDDIRAHEDVLHVEVRWAETNRPCAVEEDLHIQYRKTHGGKNPKYVDHT